MGMRDGAERFMSAGRTADIRLLPYGHHHGFGRRGQTAGIIQLGAKPAAIIVKLQAARKLDLESPVAVPMYSPRPPAVHYFDAFFVGLFNFSWESRHLAAFFETDQIDVGSAQPAAGQCNVHCGIAATDDDNALSDLGGSIFPHLAQEIETVVDPGQIFAGYAQPGCRSTAGGH